MFGWGSPLENLRAGDAASALSAQRVVPFPSVYAVAQVLAHYECRKEPLFMSSANKGALPDCPSCFLGGESVLKQERGKGKRKERGDCQNKERL